jgi:hypothetical protein
VPYPYEKRTFALRRLAKLDGSNTGSAPKGLFGTKYAQFRKKQKVAPLKNGTRVEDFALPNAQGRMVQVLQGAPEKPTLMGVFSSGCSYSMASMDVMCQFEAKTEGRVQLIMVWNAPTHLSRQTTYANEKAANTWNPGIVACHSSPNNLNWLLIGSVFLHWQYDYCYINKLHCELPANH